MKIIVLGAGAIGSLYGAKLSKFNDVTLIARKKHVNNINKKGLKVTGLENKIYKVKAATRVKKIEENTLILLTTKLYDSAKAIRSIKNLVRKDTILLCLQNGLYSEDIAKKILGRRCTILRGITNFGAIFLKPGTIKFTASNYTSLEKGYGSKNLVKNFNKCRLVKNFNKCRLNASVSANIKKDVWKKLIFNCILNPVTAILKIENKGISDQKLNPLKRLITDECLSVAKKDGASFDFDFVKKVDEAFRGSRNVSSMQQDLMKGKNTEIDYLNGDVVKLGRKYGIKCPVNEAIIGMIKMLESKT